MTTSVAKIIIIKQPVIAGLTRNPLNNQGMLKQVQHDEYGIPSATEVVLFLELGKNKVSSHRSSIPLGMHPLRPLRPQLCAFALRFFYHKGTQRLHKGTQRQNKIKQIFFIH